MAKFKVTVIRTDEYEIEVDKKVFNRAALDDWGKIFHPVSDIEEFAKDLGWSVMKYGSDHGFMEGYGYVRTYNHRGDRISHWRHGKKGIEKVPDKEYTKGLSIKLIVEDDDYETETEKIKPNKGSK